MAESWWDQGEPVEKVPGQVKDLRTRAALGRGPVWVAQAWDPGRADVSVQVWNQEKN